MVRPALLPSHAHCRTNQQRPLFPKRIHGLGSAKPQTAPASPVLSGAERPASQSGTCSPAPQRQGCHCHASSTREISLTPSCESEVTALGPLRTCFPVIFPFLLGLGTGRASGNHHCAVRALLNEWEGRIAWTLRRNSGMCQELFVLSPAKMSLPFADGQHLGCG